MVNKIDNIIINLKFDRKLCFALASKDDKARAQIHQENIE